jgi:hypothetical protein
MSLRRPVLAAIRSEYRPLGGLISSVTQPPVYEPNGGKSGVLSLASQGRPTLFSRSIVTGAPYIPISQRYRGGDFPQFGASRVSRNKKVHQRIQKSIAADDKPHLGLVDTLPMSVREMDNANLAVLASLRHHDARKEVLKRHIMSIDRVSYDEAEIVFRKIQAKHAEFNNVLSVPYRIGVFTALTAGFLSFPMVFHLQTAEWFNALFVTTDVPEPKDIETFLEVGSWTWGWMEPPLGQISFFLLCLQYSRAQLENLGIKPYTQRVKRYRAERLAQAFPQYDPRALLSYSETCDIIDHLNY